MTPSDSRCSFGLVDGRPVFMDLEDDSYFMLEPAAEGHFRAVLDERPTGEQGATGLPGLGPVDGLPFAPARCAGPAASVLDLARERSRGRGAFLDALRIWLLLLKVRSQLRHRPIAAVVGAYETDAVLQPARPSAGSESALARRFARARAMVPIPRNCLADSLALLRWLIAHQGRAMLVFGVKLDPFAAHCWVQTEELLLNDIAERVERFTPVRIVECAPATL
jgi:hypothetical protein